MQVGRPQRERVRVSMGQQVVGDLKPLLSTPVVLSELFLKSVLGWNTRTEEISDDTICTDRLFGDAISFTLCAAPVVQPALSRPTQLPPYCGDSLDRDALQPAASVINLDGAGVRVRPGSSRRDRNHVRRRAFPSRSRPALQSLRESDEQVRSSVAGQALSAEHGFWRCCCTQWFETIYLYSRCRPKRLWYCAIPCARGDQPGKTDDRLSRRFLQNFANTAGDNHLFTLLKLKYGD